MGSTLSPEFQRALEAEIQRLAENPNAARTVLAMIQEAGRELPGVEDSIAMALSNASAVGDSRLTQELRRTLAHVQAAAKGLKYSKRWVDVIGRGG